MEIREVLKKYEKELIHPATEQPRYEVELLLSFVIGKPREYLLTHPEATVTEDEIKKFAALIDERANGTPIAYLIGQKSFYGLDFFVNENVLIPRPETELIVDEALVIIKNSNHEQLLIADIATGSGCIIAAIAKNLPKERKNITLFASDISPKALIVAKQNIKKYGLTESITLTQGDLLEALLLKIIRPRRTSLGLENYPPEASRPQSGKLSARGGPALGWQIIITANLPYLTPEQIKDSPSIQKEPFLALDGGKDGMELYIRLFEQTKQLKSMTEADISLLAEIDHTQTEVFISEVKRILPTAGVKIKKDLGGYERMVIIDF
jgi:release factor glutamine methyltransferase